MKKLIITAFTSLVLAGCVSKRESINTTSQVTRYEIKEEVKTNASGVRLWLLFIPIGIGSNKYETRKEKVIHRFNKKTKSDAIQNGEIVDRKIIVPLILVNLSIRFCSIKGKPCYIVNEIKKPE